MLWWKTESQTIRTLCCWVNLQTGLPSQGKSYWRMQRLELQMPIQQWYSVWVLKTYKILEKLTFDCLSIYQFPLLICVLLILSFCLSAYSHYTVIFCVDSYRYLSENTFTMDEKHIRLFSNLHVIKTELKGHAYLIPFLWFSIYPIWFEFFLAKSLYPINNNNSLFWYVLFSSLLDNM